MSIWTVYLMQRRKGRGWDIPITHRYMAAAPGCPMGAHPTRECGCKPFRTLAQAQEYIRDRTDDYAVSLTCADGTCPNGPRGGLRKCHAVTCWCECHGPERRS